MNTSSLKTFAQNARNKLRAQVAARLNYWLGAEGGTAPDTAAHRQFAPQIKELAEALKKEGRDGLVERISYTWFNRLAALRFMDANDFHPFGVRVVTPAGENEILPALLQQARAGALNAEIRAKLANPQAFDDILSGRIPVAHPETELFGMLLLAACNYYHAVMPFLFEKLGDATQLLLPEDLLSEQSILTDIRENLTDEDCTEVEVIGWLYQFYISEKKDEVMGRKKAVPTEDIPAVTQLFTPHWIVRYLVENSLGRLWLLNRPHSRLREQMPYYIEGEPETHFLKIAKPEDIKLVDPACGSGHILTYAFDLLYLIYEEEGYDAPEIPSLILKHNLHGLEICDRAAALAAFALCMKARAKDRRFFKRLAEGDDQAPRPHIIELQDVRFDEGELAAYFKALGTQPSVVHPNLVQFLHQFEEAKNFGSLIQPCLTEAEIHPTRSQILNLKAQIAGGGADLMVEATHQRVLRVLEQAEALTQRYHVVVANPPYMGSKTQNPLLRGFLKDQFEDYKSDLFSAFIIRSLSLVDGVGFLGFMSPFVWMFLSSYEEFRKALLNKSGITTLIQPEYHAFFESAFVPICAFTLCKSKSTRAGVFIRLCDFYGEENQPIKTLEAIANPNASWRYEASPESFSAIPGMPIAYWVSDAVRAAYQKWRPIGEFVSPRKGNTTTDNGRFLRRWSETSFSRNGIGYSTWKEAGRDGKKWIPYNKGGGFRKWYGNNEFLVNWENNGSEIKAIPHAVVANEQFFFQPGLTWTTISSSNFSVRRFDHGYIFDNGGCCVFGQRTLLDLALGFLNSTAFRKLFGELSATLNFQSGEVAKTPFITESKELAEGVTSIIHDCFEIARADWDNFETSWDFRDPPLLRLGLKGTTLEASWRNWETHSTATIRRMQELETENNRLFIAAYGLEDELQPEVPEEQITLARADARRDMAAFLSYAVGCMMGRYSLDAPGLILANAEDTVEDYVRVVNEICAELPEDEESRVLKEELMFPPDADGILPILDGEWFTDDIVGRFRGFLRVTFGEESFAANLRYVEESLGKPDPKTGRTKPTEIRSYFVNEFYKNHISGERAYGYKKRPIYWMVSSPKGSFQALIYLHRYSRDTLNRVLDGYVRPFLDKLEQRQQACTVISNDAAAKPAARTAAAKELLKLGKMLKEIREWERDTLLPLAQKRIEIDLDDGVKVNYLKFKGILVPIAGLEKKEED